MICILNEQTNKGHALLFFSQPHTHDGNVDINRGLDSFKQSYFVYLAPTDCRTIVLLLKCQMYNPICKVYSRPPLEWHDQSCERPLHPKYSSMTSHPTVPNGKEFFTGVSNKSLYYLRKDTTTPF